MRRFYLHKRAGIYYAELVDPETGNKLPAVLAKADIMAFPIYLANSKPALVANTRKPILLAGTTPPR